MRIYFTFAVLALVGSAALAQDPEYLSPLARQLSRSDLDEIERVIALKTPQPIVAICGENNPHIPGYRDTFFVATASPARPHDRDIGCYQLERTRRGWRIVHGVIDPDTSFVSVVRRGP